MSATYHVVVSGSSSRINVQVSGPTKNHLPWWGNFPGRLDCPDRLEGLLTVWLDHAYQAGYEAGKKAAG